MQSSSWRRSSAVWGSSRIAVRPAWLIALALTAARAAAQDSTRLVAAHAQGCDGRLISAIDVRPQSPYFAGLSGQWRWIARRLTNLHATTRAQVVRRFLLVHVGDPCTLIALQESERVLRAQPFLAEARVSSYDDGHGGVRVDVFTVDEIGLLAGLNAQSGSPYVTRFLIGEGNLAGQGIQASADWHYYQFYRDRYALNLTDYDFLAKPYRLTVDAIRQPEGGQWDVALAHPFLSELQRAAWVLGGGSQRVFYGFQSPLFPNNFDIPAVDFTRSYWQIGGIIRVGAPGTFSLFGGSLSQERELVSQTPVVLSDSGLRKDTSSLTAPTLTNRFAHVTQSGRINVLWGFRDVDFLRVSGFDVLSGDEDLRRGLQFGTFFGHSVAALGTRGEDTFVSSAIYTGAGTQDWFLGMQAQGEGRENDINHGWDGILVSGRAAAYWKPAGNQVFILDEEYGLGLRQRIPFQLGFADFRGGIRGYRQSQDAGGERSVSRLEYHYSLPPIRQLAQIGVGPFVDVGRLWAQDTPFAVNTPFTVGTGLSIFVAVPPRSRRMWRLDIAFPVTREPHVNGVEFRFTTQTFSYTSYTFYLEPHDISNAREQVVPASIFNYP
jgi:hypothetical protein